MEEPAAAGIAGAAIGDVGEPDGFFWSSSEDSKEAWPVCLSGRPRDNLREAELAVPLLQYANTTVHLIKTRCIFFSTLNTLYDKKKKKKKVSQRQT